MLQNICLTVSLPMVSVSQIKIVRFQIFICKTNCCGWATEFSTTQQTVWSAFYSFQCCCWTIKRMFFLVPEGVFVSIQKVNKQNCLKSKCLRIFQFGKAVFLFCLLVCFKYCFPISSKVIQIITKRDQRRLFFHNCQVMKTWSRDKYHSEINHSELITENVLSFSPKDAFPFPIFIHIQIQAEKAASISHFLKIPRNRKVNS